MLKFTSYDENLPKSSKILKQQCTLLDFLKVVLEILFKRKKKPFLKLVKMGRLQTPRKLREVTAYFEA